MESEEELFPDIDKIHPDPDGQLSFSEELGLQKKVLAKLLKRVNETRESITQQDETKSDTNKKIKSDH